MGYTHYWTINALATPEYKRAIKEIKKLIEWEKKNCVSSLIENNPTAKNEIDFNGALYETSCENFALPNKLKNIGLKNMGFCKTNRHEYDLMVVASLFILKKHMGSAIVLQSDGYDNPKSFDEEIFNAFEFYKMFQDSLKASFSAIPLHWYFS